MLEAVGGIGQVQRPVEAEDNDDQKRWYDDIVDWFNG